MRRLLIIVIVAALAYATYWFVGARAVAGGLQDAIAQMRADGWDVRYDDLRTRGFPSRFDTTVTELSLQPPGGPVYTAPFLQVFALSYRPNRVIVAFPPAQTLTIGDETLTLASTGMKASAAVRANTALDFQTLTLAAEGWSLANEIAGLRMGETLMALRANTDNRLDAYATIDRISLPDDLWQQMFPHGGLPLSIDRVQLDATATLTAPLNRTTLAAGPVGVTDVQVKEARLAWGDLSLTVDGTLTADAAGFAAGTLMVTAQNIDKLAEGLARIGVIQPGVAAMVAGMDGGSGTITLPVRFENGKARSGFIPLGDAPRLR